MPMLLMPTSTRDGAVFRGCPYLLVDAETGSTVSLLTVKQCLHQYNVDGDFWPDRFGGCTQDRQDGSC